MTHSITNETLDGLSLGFLKKIQSDLRTGKFKFSPGRQVMIPKPGKPNETRPLVIGTPREKIVQMAIAMILNNYYNDKFHHNSHGFRPGRGVQTALRQLDSDFQSSRYIIEADISKAFDSISHKLLLDILMKDIKCTKTLSLLKTALDAGYIDQLGVLHEKSQLGTPQGNIISPILCNIFLHQLDLFIDDLKKNHECGTKRFRSSEYASLSNRLK